MSFTIFQNEKMPFQAIKTRTSKSRKIDIFLKGLTHGFGPKMAIFPTFFFWAIQTRNMSFTIFQKEKNAFLGYKNKKFKKSKNSLFCRRVNPWFSSKKGHFCNFFFLGNIDQEKVFYDILERKMPLQAIKTRSSKSPKDGIFLKVLTHAFGPKMAIFPFFFLGNINQENVF